MSGGQEDPVEILDDDDEDTQTETPDSDKNDNKSTVKAAIAGKKNSDMPNTNEPQPSTSKASDDTNRPLISDDEDDDPGEYNVEAIRAKRKNQKTGVDEYYIKWENYPESENTWEPLENLKCPELISKFNENEANKRRRKKAERLQASASKRPRREAASDSQDNGTQNESNGLFLEDDDDESDQRYDASRKKSKSGKDSERPSEPIGPKGFERKLPIERIITASVGDDDKLYFFLKWQGRNDIELVEADELEKHGSYALCRWYRDRLYWEQKPDKTNSQ